MLGHFQRHIFLFPIYIYNIGVHIFTVNIEFMWLCQYTNIVYIGYIKTIQYV